MTDAFRAVAGVPSGATDPEFERLSAMENPLTARKSATIYVGVSKPRSNMRRTRIGLCSLLAVAILALAVEPAAAQTSATAELINTLNGKLLWAAIPITLLVELILLYTVLRFKDNDEAKPTRENRRLEISWTIATALVLVFVGVASYGVLANDVVAFNQEENVSPATVEEDAVVVRAVAFQWGWDMEYPEHNITSSAIVIPADRPVYIEVTSRDVIHAFHVPELGLKQDAMPGEVLTIKTVAYEPGVYQGYCAEFCGVAHSQMTFTVDVRSEQAYQSWLQQQKSGSGGGSGNGTASGGSGGSGTATPSSLSAPANS